MKRSAAREELQATVRFRIVYQRVGLATRTPWRGNRLQLSKHAWPNVGVRNTTDGAFKLLQAEIGFSLLSPPLFLPLFLALHSLCGVCPLTLLSRVQAMGWINCSLAGVDDCQVNSCVTESNTLESRIGIRI